MAYFRIRLVISRARAFALAACTLVFASAPIALADAAQPAADANADADADMGGGVITSQPVTVAGNDFCQYFAAAWRDKDSNGHYALAIRERPSARWGSEVSIEYAHRRIYRTQLPASRAAIRGQAEDAAQAAYEAVRQADLERRLLQDADLAPDEF